MYLWVDHTPSNIVNENNLKIRNINYEVWDSDDLLLDCTNHAMRSDILRLEIVYKFGGIYVDIDATAQRSFGPIFSTSFLNFRPGNWTSYDQVFNKVNPVENKLGSAGFDTNVFGFPAQSKFLQFVLRALRENFPTQSATLWKTGPVFLKEAFLQYKDAHKIQLVNWEFLGRTTHFGIFVDPPGNADWSDDEDIRIKKVHEKEQQIDSTIGAK